MTQKLKSLLLILAAISILSLCVWAISRQLFTRAVQGEAKLMMSYIHTLERVYRLEKKDFIYWDPYYGASLQGSDNCIQPEPAAELGFLLPGCHREKTAIPRYAYRVRKGEKERYSIEARSGSDKLKKSFVCFADESEEIWVSSQNMDYKLEKPCL